MMVIIFVNITRILVECLIKEYFSIKIYLHRKEKYGDKSSRDKCKTFPCSRFDF